ncbi:MAG TPA: secretion protein [Acidimicrobiaceae bacterium]|nr:secretion protein [Acidimicrobiaceae bacterium]HCB37782.1 secretion protein [Acidimicrobiaceae bacterium]
MTPLSSGRRTSSRARTPRSPAPLVETIHERFLPTGEPRERDVAEAVDAAAPLLGRAGAAELVSEVLARLAGTGALAELWDDDEITEVMINGAGPVSVERRGELVEAGRVSAVEVERLVEYLLGPTGRRVDRRAPIVDVRLDDRTRCNIVVPPVAVDGPYITLRRFPSTVRPLEEMADEPTAERLRALVAAGANLLVFGPTSTGKTSLLASLLAVVPDGERVVVVEESVELPRLRAQVVRLEGQPANIDGRGAVPMSQLVVSALRMRPDRIVVGEVRGPEAADLLQALTLGHRGSLSTLHAGSGDHALWRLEQLARQGGATGDVGAHIVSVVDALVHMGKMPGGRRTVIDVIDVAPRPARAAEANPAR